MAAEGVGAVRLRLMPHGVPLTSSWLEHYPHPLPLSGNATLLLQVPLPRASTHAAFIGETKFRAVPKIFVDEGLPRDDMDGMPLCCNEKGKDGASEQCLPSCELLDPRFARRKAVAQAKKLAAPKAEKKPSGPVPRGPTKTWWEEYAEKANSGGFIGLASDDETDGPIVLGPEPRSGWRRAERPGYVQ